MKLRIDVPYILALLSTLHFFLRILGTLHPHLDLQQILVENRVEE